MKYKQYYYIHTSAVCSPACVNGGTCTAPNRCSCQTGWTGSNCATGKNYVQCSYMHYMQRKKKEKKKV